MTSGHDLGRRRWLGTVAAAAVASACDRQPDRKAAVQARFVGQSPRRGHQIRDGVAATGPTEQIRCDVVIVGAGAAGMAAAWRLARAKKQAEVHIVELEPDSGGTARSGQLPRSVYPMGAHYLPAPRSSFQGLHTLLEDLGVILGYNRDRTAVFDPTIICRAPVERHRYRGRWFEGIYPAHGQTDDEAAQWSRWQTHLRELDGGFGDDQRRLFDLPVDRSSTQLRHLDQISMARYLDDLGLTSWRLRWTVDYACRDDYGCTLEQTSAFAGLHHYLARGLEDVHDRFLLAWPQGNHRLVQGMAEHAGVLSRLRRDTAAFRIDPDTGTVDAIDLAHGTSTRFFAKVVLWAAPRFLLRHVLPSGRDPSPRGALEYSPWLVANLEVDRRPTGIGAPAAWDNVPVGADNLGYVVANHGDDLLEQRRDGAVLTYYEPLCAHGPLELAARRQTLLERSLDVQVGHVTEQMQAIHPGIASSIRRIDIARWGHAMVRPTPGTLFGTARQLAAAAIGRVLPCAADVSGLPLFEQAFATGVRAAESALARLGVESATIL